MFMGVSIFYLHLINAIDTTFIISINTLRATANEKIIEVHALFLEFNEKKDNSSRNIMARTIKRVNVRMYMP